jgi:hypothetical protein
MGSCEYGNETSGSVTCCENLSEGLSSMELKSGLGLLQSTVWWDRDKLLVPRSGQLGPRSELEPDIRVAQVMRCLCVVVWTVMQTELCATKKWHGSLSKCGNYVIKADRHYDFVVKPYNKNKQTPWLESTGANYTHSGPKHLIVRAGISERENKKKRRKGRNRNIEHGE